MHISDHTITSCTHFPILISMIRGKKWLSHHSFVRRFWDCWGLNAADKGTQGPVFQLYHRQPFTQCVRVQSREETRSQGQTGVKKRLSPQPFSMMLQDKQSIQEVTHESPPHNSHVATLKCRGPPILTWKVYKHYMGKRLKRNKSREKITQGFFFYPWNEPPSL